MNNIRTCTLYTKRPFLLYLVQNLLYNFFMLLRIGVLSHVSVITAYNNNLNTTVAHHMSGGYFNSPLSVAVEYSLVDMAKFLLEAGADTTRLLNRFIVYNSLDTWKVTLLLVRWGVYKLQCVRRLAREVHTNNTVAASLYLTTGVYTVSDLYYVPIKCVVYNMLYCFPKVRSRFNVYCASGQRITS